MSSILPSTWKIPPALSSRLGEQAGRQRMMAAEGHLLLILHKLPRPGNSEREPILFWRDPSGDWRTTGHGGGVAELKGHLEEFGKCVDQLEHRMQAPPDSKNYFAILQVAGPLLRAARNMQTALQQAREAIPADRHLLLARDEALDLERSLELLHADAKNGMEYMIARQAEEQAEYSEQLLTTGHRLNMLIAIFLPLTALGSAFGMNLRHGLEAITSPLLFWGTLSLGLALGFLVKTLLAAPSKRRQR